MPRALRNSILTICGLLMLGVVAVPAQDTLTVPANLVQYPDLIVYNGKIVTMDNLDPLGPAGTVVEAMAIRGDRIQFLGSDAEMLRLAGPQTRKIDLQGRTVVPGLIDAHNHLHNGFVSRWANENPQEVLEDHEGI